ncbi:MAG TPA: hypothetical protein VM733_09050 [Thermoanaerobaculia bacterium]|nr:hypothetical protein [Thermoanaerobaculia bacterium]
MEDIRTYLDDDDQWRIPDDERGELLVAGSDEEPPFHIPRD